MRFSVDAHAIGRHLTGNEVYIRSLLSAFAGLDHDSEFIAYLSMPEAREWVPSRFRTRWVSANPFIRLGCDLTRKLRQDRPDLIHVQYTAPLACPAPIVASVHDVSFLEHPEYFPPARALQLQWTVRHTVNRAVKILTGSEFSRDSIAKAYGVNGDNVVVVPNAAAAIFRPMRREHARAFVLSKYGLAAPFLLTVGDLQPRKNHIRLIQAFADLVGSNPSIPHHLVLAGKETWFASRVLEAARQSGVADRIRFAGFVSDDDLLRLYNACDVFVFPSLYEGFGLPILEAMACGRAVACSNSSAMLEVANGAAILFDPESRSEMAHAMSDLIVDGELRARMERLGLQRSSQFSWQRTAERTLEVYREVAMRARPSRRATTAMAAARK